MFYHLICMLVVLPLPWDLAFCHLCQRHPLNQCQGPGCTLALQNFIPLVLGDAEAAFGHLPAPRVCVSPLRRCWLCRKLPAGGSCLPQGEPQALTFPSAQLMQPVPRELSRHRPPPCFVAFDQAGFRCSRRDWLPAVSHHLPPAVVAPQPLWLPFLGACTWDGEGLVYVLGGNPQALHVGEVLSCPSWMRNLGTFLDAGLAKWGSQECLFEVLQHSEGTISNPESGFCSHTAHGAVISLPPVSRSSFPHCCAFPVPKLAVLGLFSYLWASLLSPW